MGCMKNKREHFLWVLPIGANFYYPKPFNKFQLLLSRAGSLCSGNLFKVDIVGFEFVPIL